MKKIKKLLPMLLMSIMSVSAFAEDAVIDGIKYSLNDETSEAEVIKYKYSGDITIPESVDYNDKTYSVTNIGDNAFYFCSGLTSVTIGNSVTNIGDNAFYGCSGLTSVTIDNSVTNIGDYAFYECSGLASVTIGNSVTNIGDYAFFYCSGLKSVTIPNSVTSIGTGAFGGCSALESIIVEEGNTIYDSRENCNAIIETATNTLIAGFKNTVIPNSITSIGKRAFSNCSGLTSITIPNSVTSIGGFAFSNCSGLTSITIPNSVTSIGERAFSNCSGLTSVTIGNSVTSIGDYAFDDCSGLTSITIPNSVTSIGDWAFDDCTGLTSVTIGNSVTSIGRYAFCFCTGLTEITIPNSVTSIGEGAFKYCSGLTSVISLIEEPFEINENTFYNSVVDHDEFTTATLYVPVGTKEKYESTPAWNKFKMIVEHSELIDGIKYRLNDKTLEAEVAEDYYSGDIIIPETVDYDGKTYSVTSIGERAFSYCAGLTSVTIGNSVTNIGDYAFDDCSGLTSITIPNSVTSIGDWAFDDCTGLTSVTIGNSVTSIGRYAFCFCTGLTEITIPNSVTSIGEGAFKYCSGLTSVISLIEEPFEINENTFYNSVVDHDEFTTATLYVPAGTKEKYESTPAWNRFENIVELSELIDGIKYSFNKETLEAEVVENTYSQYSGDITIPEKVNYKGNTYCVTSIGDYAFYACTGLTSVTIGNSVTSIGEYAFLVCGGLTSVTIGNSVTSIGDNAFLLCEGLTSVTIPNSVTSIGYNAFSGCSALESIIVEEGNTIYDSRENCNAIIETETNTLIAGCKNTVIPNSVTSIGERAFLRCSGLTSITIPNSVTSISDYAFYDCTCLTSVISLIEEPFEINENTFYNRVEDHDEFTTATLYVPAGTKSKYESTPAWNKFKMIVEQEVNAVKSVETDAKAEETVRYNVSGQRISSPQKGLNIVKMSDGTTRKVMCK